MRELKGGTAIITGAAGGIGAEVARILDREGMNLVLTDIDAARLEKTARLLARDSLRVVCDITRPDEVRGLVSAAENRFGRVDVLVNNAGIILPSLFENCEHADIERQVRINLLGTMTCTREVIPAMKKAGGGHIATVSSMAGIVPETHSSVYTATKFALRGFNLTLAIELKRHGIGVSTIFPDSVATGMLLYEADHGGSPLTFLNPPQPPELVARAILRAITRNRVEAYVPGSTGVLSKIMMCWPRAVAGIWPLLEYLGERKKSAVTKKLRETIHE